MREGGGGGWGEVEDPPSPNETLGRCIERRWRRDKVERERVFNDNGVEFGVKPPKIVTL